MGDEQCKTKYRRQKTGILMSAAGNRQPETEYENIETDKISERETEETTTAMNGVTSLFLQYASVFVSEQMHT